HRVAGRVKGLCTDDDGGNCHVVLARRPTTVRVSTPYSQEVAVVDPATVGDTVLAVAREDEVIAAQCARGADLGSLLAEQRRPQPELSLPLKGRRLGVDAPNRDHVFEKVDELVVGHIRDPGVKAGVAEPGSLSVDQLNKVADTENLGGGVILGR